MITSTLHALIQQPSAPAGPAGGQAAGNPADIWFTVAMWGTIFFFFYLIFIRPAQRQEKQRREQLSRLKKNDEVVICGGLIGKIVEIKEKPGGIAGMEDVVIVRIDDKTRLSVLRSAVSRVEIAGGDAKDKDVEASK